MAGNAVNIKGTNENDSHYTAFVADDGFMGIGDGTYATSGTLSSGPYGLVFAHSTSVLNMTSTGIGGTITAVTVPAGAYYRCPKTTSITVTSGAITAYESRSSS